MGSRKLQALLYSLLLIQAFAVSVSACDFCSTKNLPKSNTPPPSVNAAPVDKSFQPPGFVVRGAIAPASNLGNFINGYLDSVGKDYPVEPDSESGRRGTNSDSDITVTDPSEVYNSGGNQ